MTSDFPASAEFIEQGVTGHRFRVGDDEELARLIDWHREHPEDSREIGGRGRTRILEQFHPQATTAHYAGIYDRLVAAPGQHSK